MLRSGFIDPAAGRRAAIVDRQPPGFAVAGLGVTGGGLVLGWGWLSTVGIAPLIVSAAPCLIMCALGLCMKGRGRQPSDISNREAEYLMLATMSLPVSLSSSFAVAHGSGMASGMMGHGVQGCMQMMQGMNGGAAQRPNQQWRHGQIGLGGERLSPRPRGRSSPE